MPQNAASNQVFKVCLNYRTFRVKGNSLTSPFRTNSPAYNQRQSSSCAVSALIVVVFLFYGENSRHFIQIVPNNYLLKYQMYIDQTLRFVATVLSLHLLRSLVCPNSLGL